MYLTKSQLEELNLIGLDKFKEKLEQEKALRDKQKIEEKARRESDIEKVKQIFEKNNIRINIEGCGCGGSPCVSLEYEGEMILDEEEFFQIEMIGGENA